MRNLAIFDLDHTILNTSSYRQWIDYLGSVGIIDSEKHLFILDEFNKQYAKGTINSNEFIEHQLSSFKNQKRSDLIHHRKEWFNKLIIKHIKTAALSQINHHRENGDMVMIATATCSFIVAIISEYLKINHLVGMVAETNLDGQFTGRHVGIVPFKDGKLICVDSYLNSIGLNRKDFRKSFFYSDSVEDIPLLSSVSHPMAVDPKPEFRMLANQKGWKVLSWI